jgi:hypothetical protein
MRARRTDLLVVLLLAAGAALAVLRLEARDRALIARHSAATDLPWAATATHAAARWEPFDRTSSDSFNLIQPDWRFLRECARRGEIALWNPRIACGLPHLANPLTASLYPPHLLLAAVPDPWTAFGLSAAFHLLLGALGAYAWVRRCGVSPGASVLASVAYGLAGWNAAHLLNLPLVATWSWLPLALAGLEAWRRGVRRWPLPLVSAALAMSWLAGWPQLALLGTAAVALYGGVLALCAGARPRGRALLELTAALLLAGGLAAPQILPTLELAEVSGHGAQGAASALGQRQRPGAWLGLLTPDAMGSPHAASDWRAHLGAQLCLSEAGAGPPPSANWSERTVYPGLVVLLAALCGVLGPAAGPRGLRVAGGLLVLMGVLASSWPPLIQALIRVPGFGVGAPSRHVALLVPGCAALAACGSAWLLGWRPARWLSLCAFGAAGALFSVVLGTVLHPEEALRTFLLGLQQLGAEERLGVEPRPVEAYLTPEFRGPAQIDAFFRAAQRSLLRLAALSALLGVWRLVPPGRRAARVALLGLLAALDLGSHLAWAVRPVAREGLFAVTPGLARLREEGAVSAPRLLRVSRDAATADAEKERLLVPNTPSLLGLRDAQGWRELIPHWTRNYWQGTVAVHSEVGLSGIGYENARSPLIPLAGVTHLVASGPLASEAAPFAVAGTAAADGPPDLAVYRVPGARRFRLPARVLLRGSEAEAKAALLAPDFDPDRDLVLVGPAPDGFPGPAAEEATRLVPDASSLRVQVDRPGRCELSVALPEPRLLFWTEAWAQGWEAVITGADGAREVVPTVRANLAFQAVPLPAGESRVVLRYRPGPFRAGALLAGLSLLALVTSAAWPRRRPAPPRDASAPPASARDVS